MKHALIVAGVAAGHLVATPATAQVQASGKDDVPIADVPAEVMAVARAAGPNLTFEEAEFETRNDQPYWDIEGEDPNGNETEFDITLVDGAWAVVETQRDITLDQVPAPVSAALGEAAPDFTPGRIIESVQADGLIVYEFFGTDDAEVKHEVSWDGETAEWLEEEWAH